MRTDIEKFVKMCEVCQFRTKNPEKKSEVKYIELRSKWKVSGWFGSTIKLFEWRKEVLMKYGEPF